MILINILSGGGNLINFVEEELFIITNSETYRIIEHLVINKKNIKIILKEFDDFKFMKYEQYLKENTNEIYFSNHQIDYKLILLWLERHIMLDEIKSKKDFICYIDWGYFRNKLESKINFNLMSNSDLYLPLITNESKNIQKVSYLLREGNNNIKEYISNNLNSNYYPIIGGGGFIIKKDYIQKYKTFFWNIFNDLYREKIHIKDDQTILLILYLRENYGNISLLRTTENNDIWFPLKTVLSGSNKYELHDKI